jgi:hypothetical protein
MFAKLKKLSTLPYAIAASVAVASLTATEANAADSLGTTAQQLITQLGSVGKVILAGGVVTGIVLMITGLIKLKQAAETQGQQVKYSEGLWRCVVGAGLIAIPALNGMLGATFGFGDSVTLTAGGDASF